MSDTSLHASRLVAGYRRSVAHPIHAMLTVMPILAAMSAVVVREGQEHAGTILCVLIAAAPSLAFSCWTIAQASQQAPATPGNQSLFSAATGQARKLIAACFATCIAGTYTLCELNRMSVEWACVFYTMFVISHAGYVAQVIRARNLYGREVDKLHQSLRRSI